MRSAACALLLSLGGFLAAAGAISVEPPDPTSRDPITLIVTEIDTCPPAPVVERAGTAITVTLGDGPCLSPPADITHRLEIGRLPAGTYTVRVNDNGAFAESATVIVHDANDTIAVRPSLGPIAGGTIVEVFASSSLTPAITFGEVAATDVTRIEAGRYRMTTPPHAAGAVEVRVSSDEPSSALVTNLTFTTPGRVGIRVQPWTSGTPIWAFLTITNNETRQVTVVSPQ